MFVELRASKFGKFVFPENILGNLIQNNRNNQHRVCKEECVGGATTIMCYTHTSYVILIDSRHLFPFFHPAIIIFSPSFSPSLTHFHSAPNFFFFFFISVRASVADVPFPFIAAPSRPVRNILPDI